MSSGKDDKLSQTIRITIAPDATRRQPTKRYVRVKRRTAGQSAAGTKPGAVQPSAYRQLLESIYDAVVITDDDGRVVDSNTRAREFLLLDKRELRSRRLFDIVSGANDALLRTIRENIDEGRFTHIEAYCMRKDDSTFPSEIVAHKLEIDGSERIAFFIRDTTLRNQAEEALRRAHKLESLQVLAGGVAHDFNNKLTTVIGNAQLTVDDLPPDAPTRANIEEILESARQMADLSRKMLAYSGRGHFATTPIDLVTLIARIRQKLADVVGPDVELVFELPESIPPVEGDEREMEQLLLHLLENAREAIGEAPGTVTLSCSVRDLDASFIAEHMPHDDLKPGRYLCIEVRDTGVGMAQETVERVFDPFFSTKFVGRGLGLAAVHGIVQGHGGGIYLQSEPDAGTQAFVFFPTVQVTAGAEQAATEPPPHAARRGTVLVVDDESTVRQMAKRMLDVIGFGTETARTGREAIELFRADPDRIDLVLLDMRMPGMNGDRVLRELRRIHPWVKVLLSSGYEETDVMTRFNEDRPNGFLRKPYDTYALAEKLDEILGG